MINLADVLRANPGKSSWATWLAKREHSGAEDILAFLELGLGRLNLPDQRRVVDRLRDDTAENVDAVLYQLTAFETCHRLKLQPEYEPKYGAKTPTWAACSRKALNLKKIRFAPGFLSGSLVADLPEVHIRQLHERIAHPRDRLDPALLLAQIVAAIRAEADHSRQNERSGTSTSSRTS